MEQAVAFGPPPLPPKTRRSPPDAPTVLSSSTADVFDFSGNGTNGKHQVVRQPEITTANSSDRIQTTTSSSSSHLPGTHVVKIRINPSETVNSCGASLHSFTIGNTIIGDLLCNSSNNLNSAHHTNELTTTPCIRINLNADNEMIQNVNITDSGDRSYFYYSPFNCAAIMSSGQVSPSDTLDSGTCSDLDSNPPPPLPTKKNKNIAACGVSVTVIGAQHKRVPSLTSSGADADSDDNESNISCDSLNAGEKPEDTVSYDLKECKASAFLPQGLLQDIRERSVKLSSQPNSLHNEESQLVAGHADEKLQNEVTHADQQSLIVQATAAAIHVPEKHIDDRVERADDDNDADVDDDEKEEEEEEQQTLRVFVEECTYEERRRQQAPPQRLTTYESDKFISFHLNEMIHDKVPEPKSVLIERDDESFAGYKDLLQCDGSSTIRSAKGTIRGVKNRVRAGIATFLSINDHSKTYKEKDSGKIVVYTTTMGVVRDTYHSCMKVKQILRTQLVKFEERDVFMSTDYQGEIRDRMRCNDILVPQVFVDGQHIGDAETIEKLNESGELRRILKPYKTMDACSTCKVCGGYNLLPCPVCNGSKKSVHRNHFTAEFVALKCMNCDEVGLVKCTSCAL